MIDIVHSAMMHWWRIVGDASPGARALEPSGVVAAVVPATPERAVCNAVLYEHPSDLIAAYDEIAAAYAEIGANWTVWVQPEGRTEVAAFLAEQGHFLDAEPMAMARRLDGEPVERPGPDALADWTREGDLMELLAVNDASYTHGTDSWQRGLAGLPDTMPIYLARHDGEAVGGLTMCDHASNSEVQIVAVLPEARGRGIAGHLLAHALADAAERGNETSTLIATKLGRPVYERVGFEALDTFEMWERGSLRRAA